MAIRRSHGGTGGRLRPVLMMAMAMFVVAGSWTTSAAQEPVLASATFSEESAAPASSEIQEASAFIESAFRQSREGTYQEATERYLAVISLWGAEVSPQDQAVIERHVEQALLAVPEDSSVEIAQEPLPGEALANWWRRQDPLPASPLNERLVEHLTRVAYATEHFPDPRSTLGLDDRGAVYVRLGNPTQRRQLDYFKPTIVQRIHELRTASGNSLIVSPSSFADSEAWYYHGPEPYHYLFVSSGRRYSIGEVTDIIPPHLRSAVDGSTGRGGAKADVVLEILRVVYEQLGSFHISYVQRLHDVDGVLSQLEIAAQQDARVADRETVRRADYSAALQRQGQRVVGHRSPSLAVRSFVETARHEDERVQEERRERAPQSRSNVLDGIEILALGTHVARFLNRDGTTRAEVYWAPEENALPLSRGLRELAGERVRSHQDQVVQTSLVRNAGSASREVAEVHYHTIPRRAVSSVEPLGVQTIVADSLKPGETFAVQWDQLLAAIGDDVVEVGPTARIAVLRTDRFELLRGDGRLEMSDIKPVVAATDEPYPFQTVEPTMPLALYFEVYGLTFSSEDQVDFRVDYEITLRREGGLLRRAREETTEGNLISTIYGTRTEQYLILNPSQWSGAHEAEVSINVRDRNTGGEVRRSITFTLVEG